MDHSCFPLRWMQISELSNKELQLTEQLAYIYSNSHWLSSYRVDYQEISKAKITSLLMVAVGL